MVQLISRLRLKRQNLSRTILLFNSTVDDFGPGYTRFFTNPITNFFLSSLRTCIRSFHHWPSMLYSYQIPFVVFAAPAADIPNIDFIAKIHRESGYIPIYRFLIYMMATLEYLALLYFCVWPFHFLISWMSDLVRLLRFQGL